MMRLPQFPKRSAEFYRQLPKVDLHRHLEGSLRFETIRELARSHGLELPPTGQLRQLVQVQEDEPLTFQNFLSKFATLRLFYRSPEIISRITREAIADAAADNVRYLELRFTPVALSKAQGFSLSEVMDWVLTAAHQAENDFGVITRLVVSVNRHENPSLAAQVANLAVERLGNGLVGLDLAGNEVEFAARPFANIFQAARQKGLHIAVHAGEWAGSDNVSTAIQDLGAERIGHGIRVLESPAAIELARQSGTVFEVCLTSNYQSGAVSVTAPHPLVAMLAEGLNVTINTDDPSISQITLSDEYRLACEVFDLGIEALQERVLAAAQAAFIPDNERRSLVTRLQAEFRPFLSPSYKEQS